MINAADRTKNFQYAIRNVVAAAEKLERSGRKVIHLNIGDPQGFGFHPPEHVVDAVNRAIRDKFTGYAHSSGLLEARECISTYATSLGAKTNADEVLITAGASEGADLVLTALVNPGDEVLLPAPGYPIYPAILNKLGAIARYYKLDQRNGWLPSVDEIRSLITRRTRTIVLINPSNPTGAITPDAVTRELLEIAAEKNLLILSDEVYRDLCFEVAPISASVLANGLETPVITLESLSKTHMLSGWRVGWMRFTNSHKMRDLISAINRLASGRLCSPTTAQYAIRPALEGDKSYIPKFVEEIRHRRDVAVERVQSIDGMSCSTPAAAFYLMIKIDKSHKRSDEELAIELLEHSGVLLVHGSGFGADPRDGYFRLVYLASEALLEEAFAGIGSWVASQRETLNVAS